MTEVLAPMQVLMSMVAELAKMRKVIEEADLLRPRMKRAERFIRQFAETWSLPLPEGVMVHTTPKPEGIEIQNGYACPECGRSFTTKQGLQVHRARSH